MDDAEVDGADLVLLVVQDADGLRIGRAADGELLGDLPQAARPDGIGPRVDDLDVAPDADRGLAAQAGLRLRLEAPEREDAVAGDHEGVRDDLLEVRVALGAIPLEEESAAADATEEGFLKVRRVEGAIPPERARAFEEVAPL